ncbi:MAG: 4a-hydroxytetrahydrobiopterin dehydratase [Acidimicrobiales bacterium]
MTDYERKAMLPEDQLAALLDDIPEWSRNGDRLERTFSFPNFTQAFGFMSSVALISERLFHHPEWSNVWGTVEIAVTNHDAGGLTELDIEFCRRVDALTA